MTDNVIPMPDARAEMEAIAEALRDLQSHSAAWRKTIAEALDRADWSLEDLDDRSYWQHELDVFDRVVAALGKVDIHIDEAP